MVIDCRFLIFSLHCSKPFFETSLQSARSLLEKPLEVLNVTFECPQSIETGLVLPFINFNALQITSGTIAIVVVEVIVLVVVQQEPQETLSRLI